MGDRSRVLNVNNKNNNNQRLMTVKEVANELNVTLKYVRDLLYEGRFEGAKKFEGQWLIPESSFIEFEKKRNEKRKES